MPQFPEKESSLLAKLKKSQPQVDGFDGHIVEKKHHPAAVMSTQKTEPTNSPAKLVDVSGGSEIMSNGDRDNITNQLADIFGSLPTTNGTKISDGHGVDGTVVKNKGDYLRLKRINLKKYIRN